MILPIVAYGMPILRKVCTDISSDYENLSEFIADMWDTMYHANGVGLASPQVNKSIRLFVIDTEQLFEKDEDEEIDEELENQTGFKKVFINAKITERFGELYNYNEGCLSIPHVREDVSRHPQILMTYLDENFVEHTEEFDGINARVIQHEYDHIEGLLFIDHINPLKKKLQKKKLERITNGQVRTSYKMLFQK